ncbi:excinuclease ABC subunit C [Halovenus sp. WSH3]|uniref:UvrABC system protein C n=1 Tax=Halovenus carboxidivorans TaxID=2692199 RepID=A0A6B0T6S5_9EURY|nr:excinuclease ABC subunit C [Halovenus carboxidivorans]MXR50590.1 excinuclease ABC subunit C [Halovenus carboxidivorans]
MDEATLRERASALPAEPGVYQFLDGDRVLYVGKAVELRDRVRSYADPRSERIRQMVARAGEIDIAVTDTESQALLLEANLIKRHRPRYNVRLKDDKSYPLVALTDHDYPRLRITRDPEGGSTVFGPFTDKGTVETVCKALRDIYGLRGCSDHKFANRDRPCLDYDIGLCSAPCTGEISREGYLDDVASVERFFNGETGVLTEPLRREMERAAQDERFERAANLRDMLDAVEQFRETGGEAVTQADSQRRRTDVLGVSLAGREPTVALLRAEDGQLVDREQHTLAVPDSDEPTESAVELPDASDPGAVLGAFIPQYYAGTELPDRLLCPEQPVGDGLDAWLADAGVELSVPGAGREATLIDLAMKNARRDERERDGTTGLAAALGLDRADRIEGFDVSHARGRDVVGSNVCFVDGAAEKSDYRRKKLTETNDDYANTRRLVEWRARRAVEGRDDRPDPDLLLIDGGEGQLDAAREALDAVGWDVPAVALAKAEEIVVTPEGEYDWDSGDEKLKLLQRVRDEAHRFAVQYHETLRDEVSTALDEIDGVGPETRKRLLGRFGSVDGVRAATAAELQEIDGIGEQTAERISRQL